MIDPDVAYDKLATFDTAPALADFLLDQDVTGIRGDTEECAIGRWMFRECHQVFSVDAERIYTRLDDPARFREWATTTAMAEFIRDFDSGEYPELDSCALPPPDLL